MQKDYSLRVSEVFYSIQGEGQTIGKRAVFLRLTGCNILCKSDTWICDTIEVWKKGKRFDFPNVLNSVMIAQLKRGAHLIITGGEPMLRQKELANYLKWFVNRYEFLPVVEVETNGTIEPIEDFSQYVDYFNVSPKLSNSGVSKKERVNTEAIAMLNKYDNTIFKFVVARRKDIGCIIVDYKGYIDCNKIWLMPAGGTRDELSNVEQEVVSLVKEFGWNYSTRLHINVWDKKTGV